MTPLGRLRERASANELAGGVRPAHGVSGRSDPCDGRFEPRGQSQLGAFALLVAASLIACSDPGRIQGPDDGGAPQSCDGACPPGQKCHYVDGECIYGAIAECTECGNGATCSPAYAVPTCVRGTCEPKVAFGEGVTKVVRLAVASLDEGCDLDGDGEPDNQLASVQQQIDLSAELQAAVDADIATVLFEPSVPDWGAILYGGDEAPYRVATWFGTLAPESRACLPSSLEAYCAYTVSRASYDPASLEPSCAAWLTFDDVRSKNASFASPSPGRSIDMVIPVGEGSWLLQLLGARLEADASTARIEGPGLAPEIAGRLCAAVPAADLLLAVDTLPEATVTKYGGRELIRDYVARALEPDLDADGDGNADSVSMALRFVAVPARIVGYSP
jgi:hypothetical protein